MPNPSVWVFMWHVDVFALLSHSMSVRLPLLRNIEKQKYCKSSFGMYYYVIDETVFVGITYVVLLLNTRLVAYDCVHALPPSLCNSTLLETLYGEFDEIATRRNVFKVETIGDCYGTLSTP